MNKRHLVQSIIIMILKIGINRHFVNRTNHIRLQVETDGHYPQKWEPTKGPLLHSQGNKPRCKVRPSDPRTLPWGWGGVE